MKRQIALARASIERRELRPATQTDIAAELGMEIAAYHAFAATAEPLEQTSIDDHYSDHDVSFADTADGADALLEASEMREMLAQAIGELPEREAQILQLYFIEEMNLHEIGQIMGTGAARICQIKKAALAKLRLALPE
jgi:RNA polymerase sigma factor FliA